PHIARSQADMRRITDFKHSQFRRKSEESQDRLPSDQDLDMGWDLHSQSEPPSRVSSTLPAVSAGAATASPPPASASTGAEGTSGTGKTAAVGKTSFPGKKEEAPFTLQVGVFKSIDEARGLLDRLRAKRYDGYLLSTDEKPLGPLHRVRVGSFASESEAREFGAGFEKAEGLITFVVRNEE
ncbi:MAG: SPOR domain-containing protein, partial [Vicinamibacteria bacterium]